MRESSKMKSTLSHELSKALLLGVILALSSQVAAEEPVGEKGALSAAGQNQAPSAPKGLRHRNPPTPPVPPVPPDAPGGTGGTSDEEFAGPFPSWANVKTMYGARGDGTTNDTAALQNALNDVGTAGKSDVVYLPAGTYRITATLSHRAKKYVTLVGEHPERTKILWAGPA